jgi:hypothetical protein
VHVLVDGERDRRAGVTEALGDDLHRHAVTQQQGGVGAAEVVQPDHRQLLLPQRLAPLDDLAGERLGVPGDRLRTEVGIAGDRMFARWEAGVAAALTR